MRIAFKPAECLVLRIAVLDAVPVDRPYGSRDVFTPSDGELNLVEVAFEERPQERPRPASGQSRIGRQAQSR